MPRREGFKDQKLFVIPAPFKEKCQHDTVLSQLYLTDIGYYPKAKDHYVERGAHLPQYVLIYCLKGKGWCELESGGRRMINSGEVFVIPANTSHAYGSCHDNFWEIYWVHFQGEQAEEMARRVCEEKWGEGINVELLGDNILLFDHIISDLELGSYESSYEYANYRLWHLLGAFIHHCKVTSGSKDHSVRNITNETIIYMKENLSRMLTLHDLANYAGMSVSYFCCQFRKQTGSSPMDFFINMKMQEACKYLTFSEMKIKDISREIGYVDQYYFSRIFTKIIGQSPRQYRIGSC